MQTTLRELLLFLHHIKENMRTLLALLLFFLYNIDLIQLNIWISEHRAKLWYLFTEVHTFMGVTAQN